jgi:hypothetical protein
MFFHMTAFVRFLSSMKSVVGHKLDPLHDSFPTVTAHRGFIFYMVFLMSNEIKLIFEGFPTFIAFIRVVSSIIPSIIK